MKWYVVQTKKNKEKLAEGHLANQEFTVFNPKLLIPSATSGQRAVRTEALFPGYLFVQIDVASQSISAIRSTRGVARLVSFGGTPAALGDDAVVAIRARLNIESLVLSSGSYTSGDEVFVTEGVLAGVNAIFLAKNSEERCYILLDILGKKSKVSVRTDWIRRVA